MPLNCTRAFRSFMELFWSTQSEDSADGSAIIPSSEGWTAIRQRATVMLIWTGAIGIRPIDEHSTADSISEVKIIHRIDKGQRACPLNSEP